jgi:four helix bundle protein
MQSDKAQFKAEFENRLISFSANVIALCSKMNGQRILWPISDQVLRSATSVGANVSEAKSSSSRRDYIKFFEIALKSANETKYWFRIILHSHPEFEALLLPLYKEIEEIGKILGSSVLTLKGKK